MMINYRTGTLDEVLAVDSQIPEFDGRTNKQKLDERLKNRQHLVLIAEASQQPIAYKLGYALSDSEFYSWLGGVIPSYRKQGIATKLREAQEALAVENNYQVLSVKSMNRYPAMLQLLISSGYHISGYEDKGDTDSSKICFYKKL
jgi:ribosomal protein S18 acetylase RimI-like enzyme